MIKMDIATLFPEMCEAVLSASIIGRARKAGLLDIRCWQIRNYTVDKHRNVDDTPYGPGKGMLLQADPLYRAWKAVCAYRASRPHVIYLDQRVLDEIVDEELSIGDYVLTGGELGALVVCDCVGRLCPGVLADESCFTEESHWNGLLEYPQYTKPAVWHGVAVPQVITNGNHAAIARWRRELSLKATYEKRPELLRTAPLNEKDRWYLRTLGWTEEA